MMDDIEKFLTMGVSVVVGVCGFFFKTIFSKVNDHEKDINAIKQDYVKESKYDDEIRRVNDKIDALSRNMVTKDDFHREIGIINESLKDIRKLVIGGKG
jgi:hypothetical protein